VSCEATEAKLRTAIKSGQIPAQEEESIEVALKQRIITSTELEILKKMGDLRRRVIMVDDFPSDFGSSSKTTEAASPINA
jgi:acyl-CoA dehydrogenase